MALVGGRQTLALENVTKVPACGVRLRARIVIAPKHTTCERRARFTKHVQDPVHFGRWGAGRRIAGVPQFELYLPAGLPEAAATSETTLRISAPDASPVTWGASGAAGRGAGGGGAARAVQGAATGAQAG